MALAVIGCLGRPSTIYNYGTDLLENRQTGTSGRAVQGGYSWTAPNGQTFSVNYVADNKGYRIVNSQSRSPSTLSASQPAAAQQQPFAPRPVAVTKSQNVIQQSTKSEQIQESLDRTSLANAHFGIKPTNRKTKSESTTTTTTRRPWTVIFYNTTPKSTTTTAVTTTTAAAKKSFFYHPSQFKNIPSSPVQKDDIKSVVPSVNSRSSFPVPKTINLNRSETKTEILGAETETSVSKKSEKLVAQPDVETGTKGGTNEKTRADAEAGPESEAGAEAEAGADAEAEAEGGEGAEAEGEAEAEGGEAEGGEEGAEAEEAGGNELEEEEESGSNSEAEEW